MVQVVEGSPDAFPLSQRLLLPLHRIVGPDEEDGRALQRRHGIVSLHGGVEELGSVQRGGVGDVVGGFDFIEEVGGEGDEVRRPCFGALGRRALRLQRKDCRESEEEEEPSNEGIHLPYDYMLT